MGGFSDILGTGQVEDQRMIIGKLIDQVSQVLNKSYK